MAGVEVAHLLKSRLLIILPMALSQRQQERDIILLGGLHLQVVAQA